MSGRAFKQDSGNIVLNAPGRPVVAVCPCGGEVMLRGGGRADCLVCCRWYRVEFVAQIKPLRKEDAWPAEEAR